MKTLTVLFVVLVSYGELFAADVFKGEKNKSVKAHERATIDEYTRNWGVSSEEFAKLNPTVTEKTLKTGQIIKTPAMSPEYEGWLLGLEKDNKLLRAEKEKADARFSRLERELYWQPVWFWGFWILMIVLAGIVGGLYWIFRQQNPVVFPHPDERTVGDIRRGDIRDRMRRT